MTTPLHRTAINLANAQRSTGPKTAEGKENACRNGMVHGFRSENPVAPNEDPEAWEEHLRSWRERYKPLDDEEIELVDRLALLKWKLATNLRYERELARIRMHRELRDRLTDQTLPAPTTEEDTDVELRLANLVDAGLHHHPAVRHTGDVIEEGAYPDFDKLALILRYRSSIERGIEKVESALRRLREDRAKKEARAEIKAQRKLQRDQERAQVEDVVDRMVAKIALGNPPERAHPGAGDPLPATSQAQNTPAQAPPATSAHSSPALAPAPTPTLSPAPAPAPAAGSASAQAPGQRSPQAAVASLGKKSGNRNNTTTYVNPPRPETPGEPKASAGAPLSKRERRRQQEEERERKALEKMAQDAYRSSRRFSR